MFGFNTDNVKLQLNRKEFKNYHWKRALRKYSLGKCRNKFQYFCSTRI